MTIQSGFFNSINGDRKYNASWFAQYFASFIGNGVFPNPSTGLQVVEDENMNVIVKAGKGWINGYFIVNDSDYVLTLDNADGVLKRIDRVVMRLNYLTRQIEIDIKKGTFASEPVVLTLQRDADMYELALADILIHNGATTITQANITDQRLNNEVCGIVQGTVQQVDTTTLFNQYQSWITQQKAAYEADLATWTSDQKLSFEQWMTQQQSDWQGWQDVQNQDFLDWRNVQQSNFDAWYASIQDILSGDVAANLAAQIAQVTTNLTQLQQQVTTQSIQSNQQFYRLAKQSNSSQREIAYLKLKQDAADRIENGTTFAEDFNGNGFGITFNTDESTNASIKNGGLVMAESNETTVTVEDSTVVNQAYDTSGNGGRKLVRLDNGMFICGIWDSANKRIRFYKSDNNGTSFSEIGYQQYNVTSIVDFSLCTDGKFVFVIYGGDTGQVFGKYLTDFATPFTTLNGLSVDSNQTKVGNVSLAINEEGTELHAAWASKNSTYPDCFNIRYAKGVINNDGSVTWDAVEQVTANNLLNHYSNQPSIILDANNKPVILYSCYSSSNYIYACVRFNDTSWTNKAVYIGDQYTQSNPSAIFVPKSVNGLENGRIWVAWQATDVTSPSDAKIKIRYSDDSGNSWNVVDDPFSDLALRQYKPSISFDSEGKILIGAHIQLAIGQPLDVYSNTYVADVWGVAEKITDNTSTTGTCENPSLLLSSDLKVDKPILIYTDNQTPEVGFNGTWTEGTLTPTTTATAVFDIEGNTDFLGAFVQKQGGITIEAHYNDTLMDSEIDGDEYQFTKQLPSEAPAKLRLELSRADISNGDNDKITRILGGIA